MYRLARRENWPFAVEVILCEVKYTVVAVTDLIFDWIYAKSNTNDHHHKQAELQL